MRLNPFLQSDAPLRDVQKDSDINFRNLDVPPLSIKYSSLFPEGKPYAAIVTPSGKRGTFKDIQLAINFVNRNGGGTVFIRNGQYVITSNLNLFSNVSLVGETEMNTILDFNNTSSGITATGTLAYDMGTVSVTNNSQIVTGFSTMWDQSLIGKSILLNGYFYLIVAVNSPTQLIVAFSFAGETRSGLSYVIAEPTKSVSISNLTIQNSQAEAAVYFQYTSISTLFNVLFLSCAQGFKIKNSDTSISGGWVVFACGTGASFENVSIVQINGPFIRNAYAGDGLTLTNCNKMSLFNLGVFDAANRGIVLESCFNYGLIDFTVDSCTGVGLKLISTFDGGILGGVAANNSTDAIQLVSSYRNTLTNLIVRNNGGYGVNLSDLINHHNLILGNIFDTNTSGDLNDGGTLTKIRSNIGPADN